MRGYGGRFIGNVKRGKGAALLGVVVEPDPGGNRVQKRAAAKLNRQKLTKKKSRGRRR